MKNFLRFAFAGILFLPLAAPFAGAASPPDRVNYQGVLRSATGAPLSGTFDMVFKFWSAETSGVFILMDSHTAASGGAITATNGLFDVVLGTGVISDGTGAGTYATLSEVFRDYGTVFLELGVGVETLSPRVQISAAPFSLNSDRVDGLDSTSLLRRDASDTFAGPVLTLDTSSLLSLPAGSAAAPSLTFTGDTDTGLFRSAANQLGLVTGGAQRFTLYSNGDVSVAGKLGVNGTSINLNEDGPDATTTINFYENSAFNGEYFRWNNANPAFELSDDLTIDGMFQQTSPNLAINYDGPDGDANITFYDNGGPGGQYLRWADAAAEFQLSGGLNVGGTLLVGGDLRVNGNNVYVNRDGADATQRIYFYNSGSYLGQSFGWNDATPGFELSTNLAVGGWVDATSSADGTDHFWAGRFTDTTPGGAVGYVGWAWELVSGYFSNYGFYSTGGDAGIAALGSSGGGAFADSDGGSWTWVGSGTYKVDGSGTVSFVQNHPTRDDKVIVYAAPEGDEVATYTRGTARLVDGEARVKLGETFAWVTNPDLGLTAWISPVGEWADIYVAEKSTTELVVRSRDGRSNARFDYFVWGLRIGFEEIGIVQEKAIESPIPSFDGHRAALARQPELRRYTASERFSEMERAVDPGRSIDRSHAQALHDAIGEFDPARDPKLELDSALARAKLVESGKSWDEAGRMLAEGARLLEARRLAPSAAGACDSPSRAEAGHDSTSRPTPASISAGGNAEPTRPEDSVVPPNPGLSHPTFPVSGPVEPGDVLVLDPLAGGSLREASSPADPLVVGVAIRPVEGSPGIWLVATTGVVEVRVEATVAPIRRGELLATSPIVGRAMRAEAATPGTILGKALDPLVDGVGTIRVLLSSR
jgi:hypothetical protein